MLIRRERGAASSSPLPFLSVVTRCYQRPEMLKANVQSLAEQSDPDYEQIFVIDETGEGLHAANQALALAEPEGEYVLILDDDDMLTDRDAIAVLKDAVTPEDPAILFFKAHHAELGTLPSPAMWGRRPIRCHVGSCDFITRRDWWERHIEAFGAPHQGDFEFLKAMWMDAPRAEWLDRRLAAVQRISKGRPE